MIIIIIKLLLLFYYDKTICENSNETDDRPQFARDKH